MSIKKENIIRGIESPLCSIQTINLSLKDKIACPLMGQIGRK